MITRGLTANLTSYDFLKFAAIVLMIADHIGHFYYPDEMWLRAIGRLSAPIWFFLIGFARTRDLSWPLWAGVAILSLTNFVCGLNMLPVTILGSMLLFRMILDPVMNHLKHDPKSLYPLVAVLTVLSLLTTLIFEYGTVGFIPVMAGYLCRNREEMGFNKSRLTTFLLVTAFLYFLSVIFLHFPDFDRTQKIFVGLGLTVLMLGLGKFRPAEYPALTEKMPRPVTGILQFGGRWSLEIYAAHLVVMHLLALYNGAPGYTPFELRIW